MLIIVHAWMSYLWCERLHTLWLTVGDGNNELLLVGGIPLAQAGSKRKRDDEQQGESKQPCIREDLESAETDVWDPDTDLAPHFGYVVTTPRHGPQYLWRPLQMRPLGGHGVPRV